MTIALLLSAPQQSLGQAAPIAPVADSPQQPGSEFRVDIRVGSESNGVQDLNQVGFDLSFEQQRLSHVGDEAGSFLGDVQYASNVDSENGTVSIGATRTDDEGRSGSGVVARVKLAVGEDVANGTKLTFSVQNVRAEDANDDPIDLAPQDLDVTVQEENQSPDANFTFDPSEPDVGETVTFDASGSSDDGSVVEYRWDFDDDGQAEETTQSATTTVSFSSAGDKQVGLTVVDDDGATGSATETVPVGESNQPPAASDDSAQTQEGQSVTTDVLANDTDPDGSLDPSTVRIESVPSNGDASVNSDGTVTYGPDDGFTGTDTYTYTVADQQGARSEEATVTIEVSSSGDPPPIAPEASSPQQPGAEFSVDIRVGSESEPVQDLNQIGFDLSFEQQRLSHVGDEAGSFLGDVQYASNVDSENGIVSIGATRTDDAGRSGSGVVARVRLAVGQEVAGGTELTFSVQNVQAEDPNNNSIELDPQDLDVTVQGENQPPSAAFSFSPSSPVVGETVTFDASGSEDPDGSIAEYRWDFDDDGQAEETTQSATTTVSFSSAGDKQVGLTVVDDDGATGSATETVPVGESNQPPAASDDSAQTQEGQSVTTDVLTNDSDPDGSLDPASVQVESGPTDGSASANDDGTITYSPDDGFVGTDSYTYIVEDKNGAESSEATVTVDVKPVNDPPTISGLPKTVTIEEDGTAGPIGFSVGDTETPPEDLAVTASSDNADLVPNSSIGIGGSGPDRTLTAAPRTDSSGTADITVIVEDGGKRTVSATLTLKVEPVNDPPVVEVNEGLTVAEGDASTITTSALSASDPDDGAADLTFEVTDGPSNGTLEVGGSATSSFTQADLESGAISYSHDGSETTKDSFAFALTDAEGAGPEGETFEITVQNKAQVSIRSQKAASGTPVDVPVRVREFTEVGSVSLVVNYDPGALSFPSGAETDDLISGAVRGSFTASLPEPGELRISWFDVTGANPINVGEGALLKITFSEFTGDTTEVAFGPNSEISDTDGNTIATAFEGGTVTLDPKATISGTVVYPGEGENGLTDGRPLSGVPVEVSAVSGETAAEDTTDSDGTFSVDIQTGEYVVRARPDREVPIGEINATDAIRTVGAFLETNPFADDFQREVADVNASGSISATDALKMALFFNDPEGTTFEAGDWAATTDTADVTGGSDASVSVLTAAYGDADLSGAEQSSGSTVSTASSASSSSAATEEKTDDLRAVKMEETFEVPVRLSDGATLGSYSLEIDFPADKVEFEGVADTDRSVMSTATGGAVRLSWFDQSGEQPMKLGSGAALATLRFSAADAAEKGTVVTPEVTTGELAGPDAQPLTSAEVSVEGVEVGSVLPEEFALEGSYPNPTSGEVTIEMDLPSRTDVTVEVYNTLGQRVQTIKQSMAAGTGQTVRVDGSRLASGQYFYQVKADLEDGTAEETGQLTVIK